MKPPLRNLSLFSGIGGMDLGLDRAGMCTVGQVEIDPRCRTVLARHWPGIPRHDDVATAIPWWRSLGSPPVDVVSGGFPCQPFSQSGLRQGMSDDRWLWPAMRDVIEEVRPTYVIAENVAGLLLNADAFTRILLDLCALRLDVRWDVVSACSVGAPHVRKRLLILAYPHGDTECRGIGGPKSGETQGDQHHWRTVTEPHRVADGTPNRTFRNGAAGNAVVPQVAELVGRLVVQHWEGTP